MNQTTISHPAGADFEMAVPGAASPDAAFDALTTANGLSAWWTTATGFGLEGGELTFLFDDERLVVRVDEAQRPRSVRWTVLSCEMIEDWVGTTIDFDITSADGNTAIVHLRHNGLAALECFEMCRSGWTFFGGNSLATYLATGVGNPVGSELANARHD